jgi:threonine aldolase
MRQAMVDAPVGDDVYDEDPTIHELETRAAEMLGQEAALFCVTGSMANLLGVWLNAQRGTEVLCDYRAHIVRAELGAHAILHGVTTRTWTSPDGVADPDVIEAMIEPDGHHLVGTSTIELENTHNFAGGAIQPLGIVQRIAEICRNHGVGLHIDGARLANACVATGTKLNDYASLATTVTLCLSKGLGAPVGSILASSAENIARARVERKRLGAGWRQAGMLAAAGLYALDHHIDRLADDHRAATALADQIRSAAPWAVADQVETNIVVINTGSLTADQVLGQAREHDVLLSQLNPHTIRAVTHLDVTYDQAVTSGQVLASILKDAG